MGKNFFSFVSSHVKAIAMIVFCSTALCYFSACTLVKPAESRLMDAISAGDEAAVGQALRSVRDLNLITENGTFPLLEAAIDGNLEIVKRLVTWGADVNFANRAKTTALMGAVAMGNDAVAEYLVRKKADLSLGNHLNYTALHIAVDRGNRKLIDLLMNAAPQNTYSGGKAVSLLIPAIKNADAETVKYLLDNRIPPEAVSEKGLPPLVAAAELVNFDIVNLLLAYGADPLSKNKDQQDPLFTISTMDTPAIISAIYAKIDPDFFDLSCIHLQKPVKAKIEFPLMLKTMKKMSLSDQGIKDFHAQFDFSYLHSHMAEAEVDHLLTKFNEDYFRIINRLLGNGANPDTVDRKNQSILMMMSSHEDQNIFAQFQDHVIPLAPDEKLRLQKAIICAEDIHQALRHFFLRHTDMNLPDAYGGTPLLSACAKGKFELASLLIENGANVNQADKNGWTPLLNAVSAESLETAELLLASGARVNALNKYGESALLKAVFRNHVPLTRLLLQHGADLNVANESGDSPLSVAKKHGYAKILSLFNDQP